MEYNLVKELVTELLKVGTLWLISIGAEKIVSSSIVGCCIIKGLCDFIVLLTSELIYNCYIFWFLVQTGSYPAK